MLSFNFIVVSLVGHIGKYGQTQFGKGNSTGNECLALSIVWPQSSFN